MTLQWDSTGVRFPQGGQSRHLSHDALAALSDYDAVMLGLPRVMDAVLVIRAEGRIDHPGFRVQYTIEPDTVGRSWAVHHREGARLVVGERTLRLNRHQLAFFAAYDAMAAAGDDIAARLRAWAPLEAALHPPHYARLLVQGAVPYLQLAHTPAPLPGAMHREGKSLRSAWPTDRWSMLAKHRYYLHASTGTS